ncbi:hypothetical protein Tco_0855219 [Tanacetum coccineum]
MAVDKYLGTKLDDALLKILERHTADLIEKYSVFMAKSVKNQEFEKGRRRLFSSKKEQGEEKITPSDKLSPQEESMNVMMMDITLMYDEGPSAGSNQGRSTKRRRSDSAASGHSEQSSDDIPMQDEGNDSDMEDTDNAHIPQGWRHIRGLSDFLKAKDATLEPEWTIPNDFPEPEINWANTYATTYQVPAENKLQRKTYDIGVFLNIVVECHKLLTNKVDLDNPEGHQILRNVYEPLPLGGPPGQTRLVFHTDSQHVDMKHGDQYSCGRLTASGLKVINKDQLERPNWDAADITFKMIIRSSQSQEALARSEDDKEEAKTSSSAIEKRTTDQKDISKFLECFVEEE